jgi:GNAT superfamily N-acetyltransferase
VIIERAAPHSAEAMQLMRELWAELDQLYGNDTATPPEFAGMEKAGAAFVIARMDGEAVGCAALRPLSPQIAEVKRLYVRPRARRAGVARAIMHELEQLARAGGFNEIWLETGLPQTGALRLYESLGYTRIAGFGDYKDEPDNVCFGRRLT